MVTCSGLGVSLTTIGSDSHDGTQAKCAEVGQLNSRERGVRDASAARERHKRARYQHPWTSSSS